MKLSIRYENLNTHALSLDNNDRMPCLTQIMSLEIEGKGNLVLGLTVGSSGRVWTADSVCPGSSLSDPLAVYQLRGLWA